MNGMSEPRLQVSAQLVRTIQATGDVVTDVSHGRRTRLGSQQVIESDDAPRLCGGHREPGANVVERTVADPANGILHGVEGREQLIAVAGHQASAHRGTAIAANVARGALPSGGGRTQQAIDGLALGVRRLGTGDVQVHQARSIRTAVALNSAVPTSGSVASFVSMLVATSSGK